MKWVRDNLFGSWVSTVLTLLVLVFLWKTLPPLVHWALLDAVWQPDAKACRATHGACWGFIAEKHRFILFGTYPYEQHWRPALASLILIGLWGFSAIRAFWKWWLALVWLGGLCVIGALMWGGILGMPYVENERWGGLILTLLLTTFGLAFASARQIASRKAQSTKANSDLTRITISSALNTPLTQPGNRLSRSHFI